jgi:tRNA G18 (ribose-2'-O)-methylase SpoU
MGFDPIRRQYQRDRRNAIKRFRRQKRLNPLAEPGRHPFVIVLDHLKPTFNIGKIFRSADAFGARAVHLVGIDFFDPAPATGSFKWVPARFHATFAACYTELKQQGYFFFTLEPGGTDILPAIRLPVSSAFIFGHEEFGIHRETAGHPDMRSLQIPQLGRVQSLNVSIAASIVMYEYLRQHDPDFISA